MEKLQNIIKSTIGEIRSKDRVTSKQERFLACNNIYNTDISDLYIDLNLDKSNKYYVYAHCYPSKIMVGKDGVTSWAATIGFENVPFYIGKGTGNRAYELDRNETHRKVKQKLRALGQDIEVKIIKENLNEIEALCMESKLIDIFGIIGKGGKLVNLDEGVNGKERQKKYLDELIKINDFYLNLNNYKKKKI